MPNLGRELVLHPRQCQLHLLSFHLHGRDGFRVGLGCKYLGCSGLGFKVGVVGRLLTLSEVALARTVLTL